MFVTVRKYHSVKSLSEVKRRVEAEFLPELRRNPGFKDYYLIDCASPESGNILTAVSIFDNWEAALASNDAAKVFVKKRLADMLPDPAQAVGGEVIVRA